MTALLLRGAWVGVLAGADQRGFTVIFKIGKRAMKSLGAAAAFAALILTAAPASAQVTTDPQVGDPDFLSFGVGGFDVVAHKFSSAAFQLEYASQKRLWIFHPVTGVMVNTDGGGDAYAGIGVDLFFANRFVVTPSFAPSFYWRGSSKNLGYPVEFRSAIAVAYRFDDRSRLGVEFYHLSNAGLNENRNPGTEVLLLKYSLPFGKVW
jgi:lipid A 3-O-deacylase